MLSKWWQHFYFGWTVTVTLTNNRVVKSHKVTYLFCFCDYSPDFLCPKLLVHVQQMLWFCLNSSDSNCLILHLQYNILQVSVGCSNLVNSSCLTFRPASLQMSADLFHFSIFQSELEILLLLADTLYGSPIRLLCKHLETSKFHDLYHDLSQVFDQIKSWVCS